MSLPTNRMPGDPIQAADINQIAAAVNSLTDNPTGGTLIPLTSNVTIPAGTDVGQLVGYRNFGGTTRTVDGEALAAGEYAIFVWTGTVWERIDAAADPYLITAPAPTFTDEFGTANDRYTIPSQEGVTYKVNGTTATAGTKTPTAGQTVTITAEGVAPYSLKGTTSWSHTFSTATEPPGLPVNDTFTAADGTAIVGRTVSGFTWTLDTNNDLNSNPVGGLSITGNTARSEAGVRANVLDVSDTTVRVSATISRSADSAAGSCRLGLGGGRTSGGNLNGCYVVIQDGAVKTYWDNGSGTIKQIGGDYATSVAPGESKIISVEYASGTVTTKVAGVTAQSGAATLTGTKVGASVHPASSGYWALDNFTVEAL